MPVPPDPENMNDERAAWAHEAICHFQSVTGIEHEDSLAISLQSGARYFESALV